MLYELLCRGNDSAGSLVLALSKVVRKRSLEILFFKKSKETTYGEMPGMFLAKDQER